MNLFVYDVAAATGGALSVLEEFYKACLLDTENNYTFCVSTPNLTETGNITVINYPEIKNSVLHRIYFDLLTLPNLVNGGEYDRVVSLQNTTIRRVSCPQTVYLHNVLPLPFCDVRFHFWDSPYLWKYQRIIGPVICNSLKHADNIVVQADWIKKRCISRLGIESDKITVKRPEESLSDANDEKLMRGEVYFFYPAAPYIYKNHLTLIRGVARYTEQYGKCNLVLTIDPSTNEDSLKIANCAKQLNINVEYAGWLNPQEMDLYYQKSILVYPSYIESFGLPIIEAISRKRPVVIPDLEYAHETAGDYENCYYFEYDNPDSLSTALKEAVDKFSPAGELYE